MTSKTKTEIKAFFETGDTPTQAQFTDFIDSYVDKSGPLGTLESDVSAGNAGFVYASAGDADILNSSTALSRLGVTVYTTALASAVASDAVATLYATTAQAEAGTATGVLMNPVLTKNAIETIAFTSADYSTTAQANAGTDNTTVMNPVLTKNAIAALGTGAAAGLTIIASGSFGSVTELDITSIPTTYRALVLYIDSATNSVATRALRVSVDTGLGLGNAGNLVSYQQIAGTTVTEVLSGAANQELWTGVTQTAAQGTSCVIDFPAYQSGPIKRYSGRVAAAASVGSEWSATGISVTGVLVDASGVERTGAITGIRITWNNVATGVFDGGTYALYGVN